MASSQTASPPTGWRTRVMESCSSRMRTAAGEPWGGCLQASGCFDSLASTQSPESASRQAVSVPQLVTCESLRLQQVLWHGMQSLCVAHNADLYLKACKDGPVDKPAPVPALVKTSAPDPYSKAGAGQYDASPGTASRPNASRSSSGSIYHSWDAGQRRKRQRQESQVRVSSVYCRHAPLL